ncbi:tyrosine-type recombinase/integrase [Vibrio owensii]|uniref:Tyr recombinase domain-containing protein n=1 Tax=Vibrio owensii CAIM 1854 = LMG 25443 TaxID=1229493 RepID=A0A0C1ZHT7_9VIBR|nr:tyrosine-type recombinase/integrase [Vibrio owensii]KIF52726.1 hypothetical protein H735_12490 [Vibrio owensii CAIM 1854 = LMG 25443]
MHTKTQAVDAIPETLMPRFLQLAKDIHLFWYDMFLLSATFGLRNIECRELKLSQIDLKNKTITLNDTKTGRANLTKKVNRKLEQQWVSQGRHWLRKRINDNNASLIVRLVSSPEELAILAEEYQLKSEYSKAKEKYYAKEEPILRAQLEGLVTQSRRIDFSSFCDVETMLQRRVQCYQGCKYLFPRGELQKNAHNKEKDRPLSRQSVYNVLQKIRVKLADKMKGIRLGLHSCRKFAVQKVAHLMKDTFAASVWVGHGNGKGNLAMTERYLNRSKLRYEEINIKLSQACHFGYCVKHA